MATVKWKQPYHAGRKFLAKQWLKINPQLKIIGVTGSYGKTNTSRAITTVLSERASTVQTDLNLDTVFNIPITILKVRSKDRFLVLEMGVDHKGEMTSYLKTVKPTIAVLTGITHVHSDKGLLGSVEGIMKEKGKLVEALDDNDWAVLNHDDPYVIEMSKKVKSKILWYGLEEKVDFWADNIKVDLQGTSFNLHSTKFSQKSVDVRIGLIGEHFVQAALAAAAVGWINNLTLEEIINGLTKLDSLKGRLSLEKGPRGTTLLDDHLRANPISTIAGLKTLAGLKPKGKKIAILGEMGELGQYAEDKHRLVGKEISRLKIDYLVSIGPLQKYTVEEALKNGMKKDHVFWTENVRQAADVLEGIIKEGDMLYLKGSLLRHLERVIMILEGKKVDCEEVVCHSYQSCNACLRK